MPRPLKAYAALTYAPQAWPVVTAPNGNRQVRTVVAATSRSKAIETLLPLVRGETPYSLGQAVHETGNPQEVEAAMSEPGIVFHATADMGRTYVRVPGQEEVS